MVHADAGSGRYDHVARYSRCLEIGKQAQCLHWDLKFELVTKPQSFAPSCKLQPCMYMTLVYCPEELLK